MPVNSHRQNVPSVGNVVELMFRITQEPPPSNDTSDEDSLTDTISPPRPSRATVALIVLAIGFCVLSVSYMVYHPPRHLIDEHIRPYISHISNHLPKPLIATSQRLSVIFNRMRTYLPTTRATALLPTTFRPIKSRRRRGASFRVGESRLVQWAQEDMRLLDMDTAEADFMVNAEDPSEAGELDLADEYIPLSVGMGWNGRPGSARPIRNYGSAKS